MADKHDFSEAELAEAQRIADAINAGAGAGDMSMQAAIQGLLEGKLANMAGLSSGYLESLPPAVKRRVKALKKIQSEHVALESQYQKEVLELDRKYAELYDALYAKRESVTSGAHEPTEDECDWVDSEEEDEDKVEELPDEGEEAAADADVKGIPRFWLTVLGNCRAVDDKIEDHDIPVLEALRNITLSYSPADADGNYFDIEFHFAKNEFFSNEKLSKRYFIKVDAEEGELMYGGPAYEKVTGCKIDWLPGKDVTKKVIEKKQRKKKGKGAGETRTVRRTVEQESFFHFFDELPPMPEEEPTSEKEEEQFGEIANMYFEDYQIADVLKGKLIPQAVLWFTGEALDYEEEDGDEDDDDEEAAMRAMLGEGDLDDEDEEHDPEYKPGEGEEKPECKQQ